MFEEASIIDRVVVVCRCERQLEHLAGRHVDQLDGLEAVVNDEDALLEIVDELQMATFEEVALTQ